MRVYGRARTFIRGALICAGTSAASEVRKRRRGGLINYQHRWGFTKELIPAEGCWSEQSWELQLHYLISANVESSCNFECAEVHLSCFCRSAPSGLRSVLLACHGCFIGPRCALPVRLPPAVLSSRRPGAKLPGGAQSVSVSTPGLQMGPWNPGVR